MEALIRFWLDMSAFTLTQEDRSQLDEGFSDWMEKNAWMKENRERVGLPEKYGFIFWDRNLQAFYIVESNGRKIPYTTDGFETPSYIPDSKQAAVEFVSAVVYFESQRSVVLGEYEMLVTGDTLAESALGIGTKVMAVLDIETIESGAVRYRLYVGRCKDLKRLAQVVSCIRSGAVSPKVHWQ